MRHSTAVCQGLRGDRVYDRFAADRSLALRQRLQILGGLMFSRWACKDLKRCIELPRQACEAAGSFSAVVAGMRLGFSAIECQSLSGTSMLLNPCAFSCERAFWALYHCRHARPPDTRLPVKS